MDTKIISETSKSPKEIRAFRLEWEGITIYLKWEPDAHGGLIAHLQIQSENREPIPITETGYRSHFCHRAEVEESGGPVAYVKKRLELEEGSKARKAYMAESKAITLF
jgi:hypothetical protein